MEPSVYADAVLAADQAQDGHSLALLFSNHSFIADELTHKVRNIPPIRIFPALRKCKGYLKDHWEASCNAHLTCLQHLYHAATEGGLTPDSFTSKWNKQQRQQQYQGLDVSACAHHLHLAFEQQIQLVSTLLRWFQGLSPGRWALPLLLSLLRDLLSLASRLDNAEGAAFLLSHSASTAAAAAFDVPAAAGGKSALGNKHLEEAARQLNKAFTACAADRLSEPEDSRKWGTYAIVNLVFRTYFKLKSTPLCKNILRALSAAQCPPLETYSLADQVSFRFYTGVLAFLDEDYTKSEEYLSFAFEHCHRAQLDNQELILQYLIPIRLLRGSLPAPLIFTQFPRLCALYARFTTAFRRGDVRLYDRALADPNIECALIIKGVYIAMERAREGCLRTLFRQVWLAKDRNTRLPLEVLHRALTWVGLELAIEETEWYVATLIHKGYMKGYISHERQMVVLSAKEAFPPLHSVIARND
ncbi:hypothetical protein K437DRAFT_236263 [Tilletiaria anomala UBC 951]|uniref:PCI domain-containing protein n=1 Tax=Tilletiaria anomala (strain ATCC 24038 / CBS 436.72 / UBC 951) TaxID=1037660 RepID=A0A066W1H7_TILAU|nr:uncharacterized protein K437DRAFT_236263 [Tilletiaria anomala UBC 951]KDN44909.1 hypothetical protein K437DRAFT_236263 [Tilletiaria anomala UBC 951]